MNQIEIPWKKLSGLKPTAWLCVGKGFSREEVKKEILSSNRAMVGDVVTSLVDVAFRIQQWNALRLEKPTESFSSKILTSFCRQEALRMLLAQSEVIAACSHLVALRRQRGFYKRLDQALQSARMEFAHPQEEYVMSERLESRWGKNEIRDEVRLLTSVYEAWMEAKGVWDEPYLFQKAIETLEGISLKEALSEVLPNEIIVLSQKSLSNREALFVENLKNFCEIQVGIPHVRLPSQKKLDWQKWNSFDDAVEFLADKIVEGQAEKNWNWDEVALVIPDRPDLRRSLRKVFSERNILFAEPRDPTEMLWLEEVKTAFLPLEVVARSFERNIVLSALRKTGFAALRNDWIQEVQARGVRTGIHQYWGESLSELRLILEYWKKRFGGKSTISALAKAHCDFLENKDESELPPGSQLVVSQRVREFVGTVWKAMQEDMILLDQAEKKAPLLYWMEKIRSQLREAAPPVEGRKPRKGLQVFRVEQTTFRPLKRIWILGLDPHWLSVSNVGNYWFTARELDLLSQEFGVLGTKDFRSNRVQDLQSWLEKSPDITVLDAHYDWNAKERASIESILREVCVRADISVEEQKNCGAHPRYLEGFASELCIPSQEVQLTPMGAAGASSKPRISASVLDRASRCSFQALVFHRWNLSDVKDPSVDLWPEARGILLHRCVEELVRGFHPARGFQRSPQEVLDEVWSGGSGRGPMIRGLFQGKRVVNHAKKEALKILTQFCEKEKTYRTLSMTEPLALENLRIDQDFGEYSVFGRPDRVDRHSEGFFVIDYKTGSATPSISALREQGYRLQLPFYALALSQVLKERPLGFQYVTLDKNGSRGAGVFLDSLNGKDPGCLTQVRKNSRSLVQAEFDSEDQTRKEEQQVMSELFDFFSTQIQLTAKKYVQGEFAARPNQKDRHLECARCGAQGVCGYLRVGDDYSSETLETDLIQSHSKGSQQSFLEVST